MPQMPIASRQAPNAAGRLPPVIAPVDCLSPLVMSLFWSIARGSPGQVQKQASVAHAVRPPQVAPPPPPPPPPPIVSARSQLRVDKDKDVGPTDLPSSSPSRDNSQDEVLS
ncbi:hypothetical protein LWI28_008620 [Acer negundo]|uniref:Uncharacterized protein n=1 Tax=Acer negundo TaxID=4023 RepID=A0AAD5I645_ACENE|nr:hypothetical protein LWI28_008620 [Acer negundo]